MKIEERYSPQLPASITVAALGGKKPVELVTSHVSLNGAFLLTSSPRPMRQLVQLRFFLPEQGPVEVMAMVNNILSAEESPELCGMEVGFFALSEEAKNKWNAFLRALEAGSITPEEATTASQESLSSSRNAQATHTKQAQQIACFVIRLKDEARARQFYTQDIKKGGMFFKTPLLHKEGAEIDLLLVHPKTNEEYRLRSTVIRVQRSDRASERGMGIQFAPPSPEENKALEEFLNTGINKLNQEIGEDTALAEFRKAVEADPVSPHAHTALGKALARDGLLEEALISFTQAIQISTTYLPALFNLKDVLLRVDKDKEAANIQVQIDGAMRDFARKVSQHSSNNILDDTPILPPDLTLSNSLIFEVLEHKYARNIDGTKPAPLLSPTLSARDEQPSVLSLIQYQKSSQSIDLIPAYPPEQSTYEELPSMKSASPSDAKNINDANNTGEFHPYNTDSATQEPTDPALHPSTSNKHSLEDPEEAVLILQPKAGPTTPLPPSPRAEEKTTQDNKRFEAGSEPTPPNATRTEDYLDSSPPTATDIVTPKALSQVVDNLLQNWSLVEFDIQSLQKESLEDDAQQECMAGLMRELELVQDTIKRLKQRTQQSKNREH